MNGASATALKSISTDLATAEGFGKGVEANKDLLALATLPGGEFSAWTNNLRALAGAVATVPLFLF